MVIANLSLKSFVDRHPASVVQLDAHRIEAEILRVGPATHAHQQGVAFQLKSLVKFLQFSKIM